MPNSGRDRYAVVALLAVLAAIVFVAWLGQPTDAQIANSETRYADYPKEHHGPAEGRWWPEVSARDTYAQWFMAILALAATGISIWAIRILRNTLDQTRYAVKSAEDAVEVTREIGEAQVRAYLQFSIKHLNYIQAVKNDGIKLGGILTNKGQSPALEIEAGGDGGDE